MTRRHAQAMRSGITAVAALLCAVAAPIAASAQQPNSDQELATKLSNPVASLISVPFQFNWDHDFGPDRDGHKSYLNILPVIPAKLNGDWTLISRVIVPIIDQHIPFIGDGSQSGIDDITGEFFFVPSKANPGGIIWGIGPAIVIPTSTNFISSDKWALGPTGVIAKQEAGWTYGALVNHLWSIGGSGSQNISNTFLQPFLSYTTKNAWTLGLQCGIVVRLDARPVDSADKCDGVKADAHPKAADQLRHWCALLRRQCERRPAWLGRTGKRHAFVSAMRVCGRRA